MPTLATDHDLATTYNTVNEIGPWERVQQYRDVITYTARHPDQGSTAVASALNQPRSRVRVWMDGGMPDPARGIDQARSHGWLDLDGDTDQARAWVQLVAWIYSGGSIARKNHSPTFFVREHDDGLDRDELSILEASLDDIGVGHELIERDDSGRTRQATHVQPAQDAVLVGRMLAAMGAPVGEKHSDRDLSLPDWLAESSRDTQRAFARVYLLNRGTGREFEPALTIREERTDSYHEELAELLRDASGHADAISRSEHNILLRSNAVGAIFTDD